LLPGGRWVYEQQQQQQGNDGKTASRELSKSKTAAERVGTKEANSIKQGGSSAAVSRAELPSFNVAEPLVRYDPIAAEKILFKQPTKWFVRNIQIALPFGTWVTGVIFDTIIGKSKENRRTRAKQLNSIIADLGPAIIKAGQALASRPDLLPSEYLEELQQLQDNVPTFSNEVAFRIVEEELKLNFKDVFELVEPEPIAAASIGQVYKARLLKNGQLVALKIQRPNTEEVVALDLYVLRWWGGVYNKIFELLGRNINLQSVMDDFGNLLYAEIDYIAEAANARRFSELYAQDVAIADVFVPKVYSELTSRKVLTMEWVDGYRLTDSDSLEANNLDRKKLVDTLVQCSLRQIMENGFFHADPHGGSKLMYQVLLLIIYHHTLIPHFYANLIPKILMYRSPRNKGW
jgi:aarF domain-containing kinase